MAPRKNAGAKTPADIDDMTDEELEAALAAEADNRDPDPEGDPPDDAPADRDPEPDAPDDDEPATEPAAAKEPDTVPHERFHHERERRKRAEEAAERRERQLTQILEAIGKNKPPAAEPPPSDEPPNLDEDPAGYIQWQTRRIQQLESGFQQTQHQTAEQMQAERIYQASSIDMAEYARERPQAQSAYTYLANGIRQYLADNGVTDPADQNRQIYERQVNIAAQAQQLGIRPGAYLEFLARQYGWQPEAPPSATSTRQPNPKAAVAAIDAEEATRAKARSMKDSGAPVETGGLTVEMLDAMSDQEFNELLEKKFKGDFNAMEAALLA